MNATDMRPKAGSYAWAITNGTTGVRRSGYQWDAGGNILSITNNDTNVTLYAYDRAGLLTNEVCLTNGIAGGATNSWQYDEAGNWLNADATSRWVYNLDNELMGRMPTAAATNLTVTVTGEVEPGAQSNKWYNTWAQCRGVSARVSQLDGTFSLPGVPLYPGTNVLEVRVRDVSGNEAVRTRTVVRTNALETFQYDGNGNLTNWVSGTQHWTYEWDWADRLTKVTSNGIVLLENHYDFYGRRIAKVEAKGGQTTRVFYQYDGREIIGTMDENAQLLESYARGDGVIRDVGNVISVTHSSSSFTNGTFYVHNNHRGDIICERASTLTVFTAEYASFGEGRSFSGTPVCRFGFSSKELNAPVALYYFGLRFFSPKLHRWISADRLGDSAGLNLFAFTANSPVVRQDPTGAEEQPQSPGPRPWPPPPRPPTSEPPGKEGKDAIKKFLEGAQRMRITNTKRRLTNGSRTIRAQRCVRWPPISPTTGPKETRLSAL